MGWSSGVELADNLWQRMKIFIPNENKQIIAKIIYEEFENFDCDSMEELDELYKVAYGE